MLARWLQRQWFGQRRLMPALWLLLPLNAVFVVLSRLVFWRTKKVRLPVPVIVVGNITVGGAGKTPLTIFLAKKLCEQGWRPGIVSRGYGAVVPVPQAVMPGAMACDVGDEPLLLSRATGVPVWVGRDRAAVGQALLAVHPEVNLLLCDDGLQHYRLARDVELAVFDGRGIGNGWRLPVGPLREPVSRLATVDALIWNGLPDNRVELDKPAFQMILQPGVFYRIDQPGTTCQAGDLAGRPLHAMAGIGDPERFFCTLRGLGLTFESHPFADHQVYNAEDLAFAESGVLLMTEKDAVKCAGLVTGETWVLPVEAELSPALIDLIVEKLRGRQIA
jgi:tetraacyldisaccharide 4'-kinase